MKTKRQRLLIIFSCVVLFSSCNQKQTLEIRDDLKKYYDQFNVKGSFVLFDQNKNKFIVYNQSQFNESFSPASTFKICNSLIGIETGVIPDENYVLQWDGVIRHFPNWNQDQDLKSAFKNSTVWYYQEVARRIGMQKMKLWLDKLKYGNADTSGGVDMFWLNGSLQITPAQQIEFLKQLHDNKLPFSQRTMDVVKKIMITKDTSDYTIRGKTGWGSKENKDIGWYVGYLETQNNVYYFVNCIQTTETNNKGFQTARIEIINNILADLKLIRR